MQSNFFSLASARVIALQLTLVALPIDADAADAERAQARYAVGFFICVDRCQLRLSRDRVIYPSVENLLGSRIAHVTAAPARHEILLTTLRSYDEVVFNWKD